MDEQQNSQPSQSQPNATSAHPKRSSGSSMAIPIAILVGFAMIAAAIYFGGQKTPVAVERQAAEQPAPETTPISTISEDDHVRGNPNAPIVIVEYSDFDCPFCKVFHETMKKVIDRYGADGKVAWVYRHFPIDGLHPSAPYIAAASECVAELGGNDAFWTFADLVFEERAPNAPTDTTRLSEFASTAGVSEADFTACIESERMQDEVLTDLTEGANAGVRGTPFSFILVGDQQLQVNGAQPLEFLIGNIDNILEKIEETEVSEE